MKKQVLTISLLTLTAMPAYAAVNCAKLPSCADLGFNEVTDNCPDQSNALKCPFDLDKAKCMHPATIGQIGYFPKNPGGGWLACDGLQYKKSDYPELAAALGKSSSTFNVPNYNNDKVFLRTGTETSTSKQSACLPNITARWNAERCGASKVWGAAYTYTANAGDIDASGSCGAGDIVGFGASRSSSVYKDGCTTPVPDHYTVPAYIYAGRPAKAGTYIEKNWEIAAKCQKGQYYYADYHCSTNPYESGSIMGIVKSVTKGSNYTTVEVVFGGGNGSSSDFSLQQGGAGMCYDAGILALVPDMRLNNVWDADFLSIKDILPSGVSIRHVHGVYRGMYYFSSGNLYYCSGDNVSSCGYHNMFQGANGGEDPGTAQNPYRFCIGEETVK